MKKYPTNFVEIQSKLLSSRSYRNHFNKSIEVFLKDIQLSRIDEDHLRHLNPKELEHQAELLLNKRWAEVHKLLPTTTSAFPVQMRAFFYAYAEKNWPTGHARHANDAVYFGHYLKTFKVNGLDHAEFLGLRFSLSPEKFAIHMIKNQKKSLFPWQILIILRSGKKIIRYIVGV